MKFARMSFQFLCIAASGVPGIGGANGVCQKNLSSFLEVLLVQSTMLGYVRGTLFWTCPNVVVIVGINSEPQSHGDPPFSGGARGIFRVAGRSSHSGRRCNGRKENKRSRTSRRRLAPNPQGSQITTHDSSFILSRFPRIEEPYAVSAGKSTLFFVFDLESNSGIPCYFHAVAAQEVSWKGDC